MVKNIAFAILCVSVLLFLGGWGTIIYGLILWAWPLSLKVCIIGVMLFLLSGLTFAISVEVGSLYD